MNKSKPTTAILVVIVTCLICACSPGLAPTPIPVGVVKGVLVGQNDVPTGAGVQVLPSQRDEKLHACTLSAELMRKSDLTDAAGAFTLTGVAPGKYCLVIAGAGLPSEAIVQTKEGQALIFEVPTTSGVDLGKVSVVKIQIP